MRSDVDKMKVLESNRRFHDEVEAETYDARMAVRHDSTAVQRMIAELEWVRGAVLQGGHIVDVGAGTGNVAIKLALCGRFDKVTAIDISSASLEKLSATAHRLGCEVNTQVSDMTPLPLPDRSADYVVGCAFLHHLPDPKAFMREVRRILKPGGAFVIIGEPSAFGAIVTAAVKSPLVLMNKGVRRVVGRDAMRWEHDQIDVHTFSLTDVGQLAAGFTQLRIHSEGFLEPVIDQGFLVAVRALFGRLPGVEKTCDLVRITTRKADQFIFNRTLPIAARISLKFSGVRGQ